MYQVGFVGKGVGLVIYFGSVPSPLFCMFGELLSFSLSCPWIVLIGPDVFCGMAGYLDLVVLVRETLGRLLLGNWLVVNWCAV